MIELIIAIFYQPFLNALVYMYYLLGKVMENPDMGLAVILFTLLIRVLLLPLAIKSTESEEERRKIGTDYAEIEERYATSEPLKFQELKKKLVTINKSTVVFEGINIGIQLAIAVILWFVFSNGLTGEGLHLLYDWMPEIEQPFNLMFMGTIDLTHPNVMLNLLSAALLFVVETLNITFSPIPPTRRDYLVQFLLPTETFIYLYTMPAGKKLFVITTLIVSIIFIFVREIKHISNLAQEKKR